MEIIRGLKCIKSQQGKHSYNARKYETYKIIYNAYVQPI